MTNAEGVVLGLRAFRKTGQAVLLANGRHLFASAGEDLVRVALVTDVPDQAIVRRVVQVMQRDSQFDHTEPGPEMTAAASDRPQQVGAQFINDLYQTLARQGPQAIRGVQGVQQWCGRTGQRYFVKALLHARTAWLTGRTVYGFQRAVSVNIWLSGCAGLRSG